MENKACSNSNDNSKQNYKDTQFFNKLCSNIPTNKFALTKINNKSSINTQASKFSSYVDRNLYTSIFEGKVKELSMTFATPTSATVIFFPVGYPKTVTLSIQSQNEQFDTQSISILTSPYTFNNLKQNTIYDITATANYSSGSIYTQLFKNAVETLNEGPPTNVRISNITNKTALISYIYPIGVVDTLQITITNVNDPTDNQIIENNLTDTYAITGLRINSTYKFVITSSYIITKNQYTVTFSFTTLFEDFPTNILFTNITNLTATVSYTAIGNPIYNNIIVVNNANAVESYSLNALETSTIWNLKSNTTYNVKITSVYNSGNKYPVNISNAFYVLNEGLPQQIQFLNIKGTSLLFSFENAIGNPSYYQLKLQNTTQSDIQQIHIDVNNTQNILIGGSTSQPLISNSIYSFQLQSVYLTTGNQYTYTTQFQTLNEGPISDFTIIHVGNNYISFSFNYPPGESYILNLIANSSVDYKSLNITTNNYTLQNILINTDYKIIINTIYILSNTTYTYTYPFTITTLNEGPSVINNIEYITNNYAYLNFYNPYAIADQYIFNNVPTNTSSPTVNTIITGIIGGSVYINGLDPNTSYITTLKSIYNLNTSTETVYTTVPSIKINTKDWPRNIQVGDFITDTSASITFVAPNIEPNKYSIFINANQLLVDISLSDIQLLDNGLCYIIINELIPNANYILSLASYYNDTTSYYTNPQSFSIITKGPVRNVNISATTTSVALNYNAPILPYNWNYNIFLYQNTNIVSAYFKVTDTNYAFNDIIPNTEYNIGIDAIYNNIEYNDNQVFTSVLYYFNTRGFPDNIQITNITNNSFTIFWNTLIYTPDYYTLTYTYNQTITYNIAISDIISNANNTSSYIVNNLNPDISYSNITISSNYTDIQTSYVTSAPALNVATYTYPVFTVVSQTNTTITISFVTPNNTVPDSYIISAINTNTQVQTDISFSSMNYNIQNYNYNYNITGLLDNTNYKLVMSSYYNVNNFVVSSPVIYANTKGTPVITSFTNIFDTYATINIKPLLISPLNNYTIEIYSPYQSYSINFDNTTNSYTTPQIIPYFNTNNTYQITITSNYSYTENYPSSVYILNTRGSSEINSVVTTDVSGIVTIQPSVSWDINNVQVSYILQSQNPTLSNNNVRIYSDQILPYFFINDLSQNWNYMVSIKVTYIDTTASYQSLPYSFYTEGPPTNLNINPSSIFNTYLTVNFIPPYNCNKYTLYAVPTSQTNATILSQTFSNQLSTQRTPINYTSSSNFLSENTNYNIYVASNFSNFNGNSNIINITTYSTPIIVDFSNNITDVSAGVLFKNPFIIPSTIKYSYNNNAFTNTSFTITADGSYITFVIPGLSSNNTYRNFKIQSFFNTNSATYTSVSNTFYTKGITNITTLTTNSSVLITFPIPLVIPSIYYYNINDIGNIPFSPILKNNTLQYTISNLSENANYSLIIKSTYSNGSYSSQTVYFATKMVPKIIDTVITDTTLSIYFTKSIIDPSYSYIIDEYADAYPYNRVNFITNSSPSSVTIPNLTSNTFYNTFKIEAYYSDINQTYSSTNYSFNTMGNPTSVVLSTPPTNTNTTTLSFYPPLYDPTYYIITDAYSQSQVVYTKDLSYNNNNIYSYKLTNVGRDYTTPPYDLSYIGISISSFYDVVTPNKTLSVNTFQVLKNVGTDNINSIATNNNGNIITFTTSQKIYYYKPNIWNTYTTELSEETFIKVVMDTTGIFQCVLSNKNIYVLNPDGWVIKYNAELGVEGKDICTNIGGQIIFAVFSTFCIYSTNYGNSWTTMNNITNATNCMMNNSYIYYTTQDGNIYQLYKTDFTTENIVANVTTTNNNNFLLCTNDANTNLVVGYSSGNNNITLIRSVDGITWNTVSDSSLNWTNISSDASSIYLTGTNQGIGTYVSENGGISWDILLPTFPSFQNTIISRNGMYMYAYDTNNVYSYTIPLEKAAVYNITVSSIYNNTALISFHPPSFIPDLSYTIIATNRINQLETPHIYYTSENYINIDNLSSNGLYDISINSNYSNKVQSFTSSLAQPFYTLSPPLNLSLNGNPSDIIATIIFTKPFNTPSLYALDISIDQIVNTVDIQLNDIQNGDNLTGYYRINSLTQNTKYSLILRSIYNFSSSSSINFSSNSISFYTRGSPYDLIVTKIYDNSVNITFTTPYNLDGFNTYTITCIPTSTTTPNQILQISSTNSTTNENVELNGLTQNTIYDISLSTVYNNPTEIISSNYSNKIYTKGGPTISLNTNNNITDVSASIQFITPISIQNTPSLLDHYELYVDNVYVKSFQNETIYSTSDISYIILTNLVPNTIYYNSIYIKTYYTDVSEFFNSNYLNITTKGYPQNIYSDYNLVQDFSATIRFTTPYNPPTNYTIFLKNNSLINKYSLTTDISTNILGDLSINTIYNVAVQSNYENLITVSPDISFITSGKASIQQITNITDTSANVIFIPPLLIPSYYTILVYRQTDNVNILQYNISNEKTNYIITDLPQNNKLSVYIQTVYPNILLTSDISSSFITYGSPNNIYFVANTITDTSVSLQFSQPLITTGISYNVLLTNTGNNSKKNIKNVSSPVLLTDLSSNSAYEMVLQSYYNNLNLYSNSNIIGFNTEGVVANIQYSNATDSSILLSFNNNASTPNSYTFINNNTNKIIQNIVNPYTVLGLSSNTYYNSQIQAMYDASWNIL